jgi:hypothetical protein
MEIKNQKTGNLIRFGGEHFKRLLKLQETTGVKHFTKKDLAGCVSADKKTKTKTKTQQKVKKLGTNSKRKQKGGVLINETTVRKYRTEECPVCLEKWDDGNLIPFQIDECGHEICTTCAERWFVQSNKNRCPLCKEKIDVAVVKKQIGDQIREVFEAIRNNNLNKIKTYVEQGGDIQSGWFTGYNPLQYACMKNKPEIVKYLVDKGADVNAQDANDHRPLHYACQAGSSLEIVKYLVNKGADVNAQNENGDTPLHYACWGRSLEIVKYLVDKGADVNAQDEYDSTPLDIARLNNNNEIVDFLTNINRGGGKFRKTKKKVNR